VSGVLQPELQIVLQGSFILVGIYLYLRTPRGAPKYTKAYLILFALGSLMHEN
jgi:hypothetical protein